MSQKFLMTLDQPRSREQVNRMRQEVADALGVPLEDVVCLHGVRVIAVEVPDQRPQARKPARAESPPPELPATIPAPPPEPEKKAKS